MRKAAKEIAKRVNDKFVQEEMRLLEADPEFRVLCRLLPNRLDFRIGVVRQGYLPVALS